MSKELFKPHIEGRARDYLLTVRTGKLTRKIIWNEHSTLKLDHPAGWVVFKKDDYVCFVDETNPDLQSRTDQMILIPSEDRNKVNIEIPVPFAPSRKDKLHIIVTPLEPISPPYKQILYSGPSTAMAPRQLLLYQGVRHFLLKYRPVGDHLTAKVGNENAFKYDRVGNGYTISALCLDLYIKLNGRKQHLSMGSSLTLTEDEFHRAAIVVGIYWWRFRSVLSPNALPPLVDSETEDTARENLRFKHTTTLVIMAVLMSVAASTVYNKLNPPKPKPVVTKIQLQAPKVIPHKIAELPKPPPPPAPPKPEPKKEIVKKEPPKPKPVAKKEPVKLTPTPKKVAKAPPKKAPPTKAPPPQVAKAKAPPTKAPPKQTMSVRKTENPPATGIVSKAPPAGPPAPSQSEQLAKSLSFLSSGSKNAKQGNLAKYDKAAKADPFMSAPSLGGGTKDSGVLSDLSAASGDTDIKTKSARTIATDTGFEGAQGKGLNDVQGRVSLTELYSGGGGGGSAFGEGSGIALSGSGNLTEAEIEKALAKALGKFQFCYEKSLLSDSTLSGNIRLQWDISASGSVTDSKVVNSQMKNAGLHSCIQKVLTGVKFPKPRGGSVTAKKTFSFKSSVL